MTKKFIEVSEEQRKVLEGTEAGKAILKAIEEGSASAERAMLETETKLGSAEKARRELEDSLLNPDMLEALASRRRPEPMQSIEEDLDQLSPSKLTAKIRKEIEDRVTAVTKELKKENDALRRGVTAAFHQIQLEALEDKHGERFTSRKDKLTEFALLPENQALRPRDVYAKFVDKEELNLKRKAEAEAKAVEDARQKEVESFAENPDSSIAPGATGEKAPPLSNDAAFEAAWRKTAGAEKLLHQE